MRLGIALIALGLLSSCACNDINIEEQYTKAENLGRERARVLIDAQADTLAVMNMLLETRAKVYEIESRAGKPVSDTYVRGFESEISEKADSLAKKLRISG